MPAASMPSVCADHTSPLRRNLSVFIDEKVDVIGHAADTLRSSTESSHGTSEIFMQACPPFGRNDRFSAFRGEDDVIEKVGVGRGHGQRWLASLPGCMDFYG